MFVGKEKTTGRVRKGMLLLKDTENDTQNLILKKELEKNAYSFEPVEDIKLRRTDQTKLVLVLMRGDILVVLIL